MIYFSTKLGYAGRADTAPKYMCTSKKHGYSFLPIIFSRKNCHYDQQNFHVNRLPNVIHNQTTVRQARNSISKKEKCHGAHVFCFYHWWIFHLFSGPVNNRGYSIYNSTAIQWSLSIGNDTVVSSGLSLSRGNAASFTPAFPTLWGSLWRKWRTSVTSLSINVESIITPLRNEER